MKNWSFISFILIVLVLLFLTSCGGQSIADANHLAKLQIRRIETIHQMLKSRDTVEIENYRIKVLELDADYELFLNYCVNKYADSTERVRFENAYKKALQSNKN